MWSFADRVVKAVSDVTVGTVIVLVHVVLADRNVRTSRDPRLRISGISASAGDRRLPS